MAVLFDNNTSQDNSSTYGNDYDPATYFVLTPFGMHMYHGEHILILKVVTCVAICIGLPLTLMAIYALYSQVRNDHVAPIYVINLLISDLLQFCYMIVEVAQPKEWKILRVFSLIHLHCLLASVCFMVCIALERYLVIVFPLWYRFRRTIKISVLLCVMVWALPLVYVLPILFWDKIEVKSIIFSVFCLPPLPLLIFFLCGTLKALSASISVPSDEKRRIVGILVLVLLIYILLFLPTIVWFLSYDLQLSDIIYYQFSLFLKMNPLADLVLYIFMKKGAIDKVLASVCCCRMDSNDINNPAE